jgi:hypothetical protein
MSIMIDQFHELIPEIDSKSVDDEYIVNANVNASIKQ